MFDDDESSVAGILADMGIRLKAIRAGRNEHVICPKCGGGKTKELSLSVTVDQDELGVAWVCHRGTCGFTGGKRVHSASAVNRPTPTSHTPSKPPEHAATQITNRPDWLYGFFAARNIGQKTVDRFGIYSVTRKFPGIGESPAIVFPYVWKGETVNRKYRPYPAKQPQSQEVNALQTLYNADALVDAEEIVFVEGEPDVLAMAEMGIAAVSLKDGAPAVANDASQKRFEALATHEAQLSKIKKFILAGDMDGPGQVLREELARRLGRHRCWLVDWPDGLKDACDVLREEGGEKLQAYVAGAVPYPIEGLQDVKPGTLLNFRRRPPPPVLTTGAKNTDNILKFPGEGRLIVTTGYPSMGKAMALDTPVATAEGWSTMGELKDGDRIYAADGSLTTVVKAHDVMTGRLCSRITFTDGASFVCDDEHLWFTWTVAARMSVRNQGKKRNGREETRARGNDQRAKRVLPSVKTTAEIRETLTRPDGGGSTRPNHSVPMAKPLTGTQSWPLEIPPYTLGAWLGDGTSASAGLTSADPEVPERIRADGYEVTKNQHVLSWYIQNLKGQLRRANLLENKHIPKDCLRAPIKDRAALLAGLMDTDGYVSPAGAAEFCSVRRGLADSVLELVRSLGIKASMNIGRATIKGRDCGEKYRVRFTQPYNVCSLSRKKIIGGSGRVDRGTSGTFSRVIQSVERVESVPVRCITVDHPSSLYLVGKELVPTHNTTWIRFIMVHTARNHDRRWCVFSPENQPWEFFMSQAAEVYVGVPFYPTPGYSAMTEDEIGEAERWLQGRIVMLSCDAENQAPTLDWIMERAQAAVLQRGVTDLLIDPWNEVVQERGTKSETDFIGESLQRLKAFGLRYGCNIWICAHPAKPPPLKGNEVRQPPGPYDISGSSHWWNKTDCGITVHASEEPFRTGIHLWKARFARWGRKETMALLNFYQESGRYD